MKKLLLLIAVLTLFKFADSTQYNMNTVYAVTEEVTVVANLSDYSDKSWNLLIKKIIFVESSNGKNQIGDGGKAIGDLQIWPIMVDDVNRIIGYNKYSYDDRWNREKSIEMFNIYQNHYNPTRNHAIAASIWGYGPSGKYNTDNWYVKKVNNVNLNLLT